MGSPPHAMSFAAKPLTAANFADLEAIFNSRGCSVARSCWCMYYRKTGGSGWGKEEWSKIKEKNRVGLKALADDGGQIGLIGYRDGVPVGWVSFGPRKDFARLANSTVMKASCHRNIAGKVLRARCSMRPSRTAARRR
jgi:hypothetical protein